MTLLIEVRWRRWRRWRSWWSWRACKHDFVENAVAKRFCTKCGEEQWLFSLAYPSENEPSLRWKTMDRGRRWGQR